MATIVTRAGKGSPLTNTELDANFTNLNRNLPTKLLLDFGADLAGTWRVLVTATLSAGTQYSTHGFKIQITDPNANHATQGSVTVDEVVYYVACVRTESTVIDTPDLCVVRGPAQHIRAVKTATGTYEIQVQPEAQYREYLITIETYATNGAHTIVYGDGSAVGGTGTAIYSAAPGSSIAWVEKLQAVNTVQGTQLISTVASGTAPLTVTSTTVVTNLNADLLDGLNPTTAATGPSVVSRDASGNFSAGTITAALSGAASSNVLKAGDSMTGALSVNVGGGTASANPSITAVNGTNYGVIVVGKNTAGGWNTLSQEGDSAIITQSSGSPDGAAGLVIGPWSASAKGLRIDSSGNLGIGTSSPGAKLDVSGNIRLSAASPVVEWNNGGPRVYSTVANTLQFATDSVPTERMRLDASGNLGLGVTPSAWSSSAKAIQFNTRSAVFGFSDDTHIAQNVYYDSVGYKYIATSGAASNYRQTAGQHQWYTAPAGTAGNAISFTQAMTLDASGTLLVGTPLNSYSDKAVIAGGLTLLGNQLNVTAGTSGVTPFEFVNRVGGGFYWYTNNAANLAMTLDANGRLGIGSAVTSPVARLDIAGNQVSNIVAIAALNIDCSLGNYFTITIGGNSVFTVSNVPASRAYSFVLELNHTSGSITWFSGVEWSNGIAPTLTTGKTHLFVFVTDNGGTRWRGSSSVNYTT